MYIINLYNAPRNSTSRILLLLILLWSTFAYGQEEEKAPQEKERKGFVTVSGSMQFWLRYASLNPGSKVFEQDKSYAADLSIRRYRLRFSGQASDKLKYTFEIGNNDLGFRNNDHNLPHLLDAYIDYQLNNYLAVGIGKLSWGGPTRYSAPSTSQGLAYDPDFIGAPLVNIYDDILRRMGIYVRGRYEGFDYRVVLAKPSFSESYSARPIDLNAGFSDREPDFQFSSYFKYQFMEHESQASPYAPATYMGKKNILNIGGGVLFQPKTTWYQNGSDTIYHYARSLAVDLFYEKKLAENKGITFYLAYINHQFGRNFMRYMGANNPATGSSPSDFVNGKGNNAPVIGTGHSWYTQLGYIRPADSNNSTQLQPYVSFKYSSFKALDEPVLIYNAGINYYLNGHRSKLTFGYQSRPLFRQVEHLVLQEKKKEMLVLQYQILFGG